MVIRSLARCVTLACLLASAFQHSAIADEPVAARGRPAAQTVLNYLAQLSTDDKPQFLSGQNLGHGNFGPEDTFHDNVISLRKTSTRWPAVLAVDLGYDKIPTNLNSCADLLALHWDHGGLVSASMHPPNPWRDSDAHDRNTGAAADLFRNGSSANQRWQRDLAAVADCLTELRDHNVIVLWRPLHEMNGDWFWWGRRVGKRGLSPADFKRLWAQMFDYFTNTRGLDNLLWVYAPNAQTGKEIDPVLRHYPGDDLVDIAALDWYSDDYLGLNQYGSYSQLASLNKPMGLAEVGPLNQRDGSFDNLILLQRLKKDYPKFGFFVFWHSWPGAKVAIVDNVQSESLMKHDLVIDRDELPDFKSDSTAQR